MSKSTAVRDRNQSNGKKNAKSSYISKTKTNKITKKFKCFGDECSCMITPQMTTCSQCGQQYRWRKNKEAKSAVVILRPH